MNTQEAEPAAAPTSVTASTGRSARSASSPQTRRRRRANRRTRARYRGCQCGRMRMIAVSVPTMPTRKRMSRSCAPRMNGRCRSCWEIVSVATMSVRLRRSCLTVPGDDEHKLAKAAGLEPDEVILDLEDAVAPERKDAAREITARALRDLEWRAATVAVRVNRGSAEDLEVVAAARPAVVVLPKVESPEELEGLPVPAEAQIETARGLVECERIAAAPGLEALVFGPGDLAASLGIPELVLGEGAHVPYALARVLVAARAFGLAAVDGPHVALGDEEGLRASARRSFLLGY